MDKKKMLKIAYAIAEFQDFVTEDLEHQEYEEIRQQVRENITDQEIEDVIKYYNGYGMDRLDDEIRYEYFK